MSLKNLPELCGENGCRLMAKHKGKHDTYPTSAWSFMRDKDKKKLNKAGFATPRGGNKGAYQNHVVRSNKVIIPYESLPKVSLSNYVDGYVIRLYPEQYFDSVGKPKASFVSGTDAWIAIGENAFILYRTHEGLESLPPLSEWSIRSLEQDGKAVKKRGQGVKDVGHYVLRISSLGNKKGIIEGAPQGVFAPEYADRETNYLCQCVLAWLIVRTAGSPYTTTQAKHLQAILDIEGLLDESNYEYKGVLRRGLCSCPLCLRFIDYNSLHDTISYTEKGASENAAEQIEGATRSTTINLFHLEPLLYSDRIAHTPINVAWGHHHCNTALGQRRCRSLAELIELDLKVGIITPEGIETFGWIADDYEMIRSPLGAVWIRISQDGIEDSFFEVEEDKNLAYFSDEE
jgi:hypothetical protein